MRCWCYKKGEGGREGGRAYLCTNGLDLLQEGRLPGVALDGSDALSNEAGRQAGRKRGKERKRKRGRGGGRVSGVNPNNVGKVGGREGGRQGGREGKDVPAVLHS